MTSIVLDASVALKWMVPSSDESLTAESLELLKLYVAGEISFIVPDIFWAEVANVLWKGVRQRRWPQSLARSGAAELADRNFPTVSSSSLLSDALTLAIAYDRPVYDCLYVALAIQRKTEMITADERLANALAASLPVKWLGAFGA